MGHQARASDRGVRLDRNVVQPHPTPLPNPDALTRRLRNQHGRVNYVNNQTLNVSVRTGAAQLHTVTGSAVEVSVPNRRDRVALPRKDGWDFGSATGCGCQGSGTDLARRIDLWYYDVMVKRATTVRLPEEIAEEAEMVARGRGVSVNSLILTALSAELDRVKGDDEFMSHLKTLTDRDKDILDRLAE